jgi:hypothetical protein
METKTIKVEFEKAKVVKFIVDLANLKNYMDKFLALKNHERHTDEILEVSGWDGSNSVRVVMLIDEDDEAKDIELCKDYVSQFGKIEKCEVETAWILNDTYWDGLSFELDHNWYVYGKH